MRWPSLTPIADVTSAREMIEEVDNAARNDAFEHLKGQEPAVQDFAAQYDREADEARERSLEDRERP